MKRFRWWHMILPGHKLVTKYIEWDYYIDECWCGCEWKVYL